MQYLGIDWGTRRAAWCSLTKAGELQEGMISADEDGLARLVARLGPDVYGCLEMMSGAVVGYNWGPVDVSFLGGWYLPRASMSSGPLAMLQLGLNF